MRKRRVWVLSELYYPEDTSTGQFLTGIAEGLTAEFCVNVLCAQPSYAFRGLRAASSERRNGVEIHRCHSFVRDKNSIVGKIITHCSFGLSVLASALRRFRSSDAVLVVTNPPLLPFIAVLVCLIRRCKCVLLVHDVYPEVLASAGILKRQSLLYLVFDALNAWLLRGVGEVVVIGRDMRRILQAKLPSSERHKITVIPNWGDSDEIYPSDRARNRILFEMGLLDQTVVLYAGNLGRTHSVEPLLECARRLRDSDHVHFVIAGQGANAKCVRDKVSAIGLANISFRPRCPREELSELLNACDLAVVSLVPGMSGVSVPSRLYNIMAAGKPIVALCDFDSEVSQVIREENIGWVVPSEAALDLLRVLRYAAANREELTNMGSRARDAVSRKYTREMTIERFVQVLGRMVGS